MDLEVISVISSLGTAVATITLVVLLYRTIKQMEATVVLSRVQTEHRFRPWVGPSSSIKKLEQSIKDDCSFEVTIKNFGELPASKVVAKFVKSDSKLSRDSFSSKGTESFDLGPVLPNMEKHYWFFIDRQMWENAQDGKEELYTAIYFEYETTHSKSGYGMLSKYSPSSKTFVHYDMWIDQ